MRRRIAVLVALAGFALFAALLAGCTKKLSGQPHADQPPHTTIFVQGPVDSVNHVAHLYWYGTDADGYVVGYEVKLVNPLDPDPTHAEWKFTARTDSVFTVLSPEGGAAPTLYVRAIDNQGVADPTPATQSFKFRNRPPVVTLVVKPNVTDRSDTTFASVTVTWSLSDPDGDATKAQYRVWLDPAPGEAIDYLLAEGTTCTVPSSKFTLPTGYSMKRTLHVQAIDDGGMLSQIDSVTWNVRRPVAGTRARVLFVDDLPFNDAARVRCDSIYTNAIARLGVPDDQVGHLTWSRSKPFKSAKDLEQTLRQFETVVWVRGSNTGSGTTASASEALSLYGDGLGAYLDAGGKFYIESMNLAETSLSVGALSREFLQKYAQISDLVTRGNDIATWTTPPGRKLYSATLNDSLTVAGATPGGLNGFLPLNPANTLVYANPGALDGDVNEHNAVLTAVALDVPQANGNGGRFVLNTFPLVASSSPSTTQRASTFATAFMRLLGLDH